MILRSVQMKEDNFFLGQIEDKIAQCENKFIATHTGFMDLHQQSLARVFCKKNFVQVFTQKQEEVPEMAEERPALRTLFYGGYEQAERVILLNLPGYADLKNENPLVIVRAKVSEKSKSLTHRDYLGSLIGLGMKREMIGDILVRDDGADIIVLAEIADFILQNYCKAGRVSLSLEKLDISKLIVPEAKVREITDTVASLRLDSIVASAFSLSRGKAAEAITRGIVFVNNMETVKPDFQLKEGDKISLRGKGKACLREVGGKSRKDRQYIAIEKYE